MRQVSEVTVEGKQLPGFEPEQSFVSTRGFHEGASHRLLRADRAGAVAPLKDRPLTLKRYPEGVDHEFFYEKQCPSYRPGWVKTAKVQTTNKVVNFCLANNLSTLVWAANLADLEMHTSLSRAPDIESPTMVVFDLRPGAACRHYSML